MDAISRGLAGDVAEPSSAQTEAGKSPSALSEALGSQTLRNGMTSESVGALQGALNDRLGVSLETDGKFGPKTAEAVKSFQTQQGLTADGIVGQKTRDALMSSKPQDSQTPGAATETSPSAEDATPDTNTPAEARDATGYAALAESLGTTELAAGTKDRGAVSALQGALNEALGKDLTVDGKFGKNTAGAVKDFQEQHGLTTTGTLNAETREALMGPKPAKTREQLQDDEAARRQAATEVQPDMIFGDRISPEEQAKVREIAQELQTSPNDLMAVFGVETGGTFDPAQRANGTTNGAVGLIQFTQTAVDAMNQRRQSAGLESISKQDLAGMNFTDQMDHVRDYLRDTMSERGVTGPVTRDELYTAVVAPAAVNRPDSANVYNRGSTAYSSNRSLDTDRNGHITREEITDRVDQWYEQGVEELG